LGGHWRVERLPATDDRWVQRAGEADLLWPESRSNSLLEVADLRALCVAPRGPGTRLAVDNTLAAPQIQSPLKLAVASSCTPGPKLIGGHSDLLLGATVAVYPHALQRLRTQRSLFAAVPGMFE
jgi:cystathionine gamma-synthase